MTTSVARARRLRAEQRRQLGLALRVDAAGRLVEDEQVRLGDEHRGERRAARARRSRGRADAAPRSRRGRPRASARARPREVAADGERDLLVGALARRGSGRDPGRGSRRGRCALTLPAPARAGPAASFASVVFPEPFGPVDATTSPRPSSRRASSSTGPSRRRTRPARAGSSARRRAGPAARRRADEGRRCARATRAPRRAARRGASGRPRGRATRSQRRANGRAAARR